MIRVVQSTGTAAQWIPDGLSVADLWIGERTESRTAANAHG